MRKVIGIGETILDIIFRGDQPTAAVPGGSVFNGIVSLGRAGIPISFISETGNDHVGNIILQFMRDNHIPTDHVNVFPDGKSPVSLAFLNNQSDAEYIFYKNYPKQRLDVVYPKLEEDDIVVIGSYYALNPVLRDKVLELLDQAREKKLSFITIPTSVPHTRKKLSNWLLPSSRTWNMPISYAARRKISFICTTCVRPTRYIRIKSSSIVLIFFVRQAQSRFRCALRAFPKNILSPRWKQSAPSAQVIISMPVLSTAC